AGSFLVSLSYGVSSIYWLWSHVFKKRFTPDGCHDIRSEPRGAPARAATRASSRPHDHARINGRRDRTSVPTLAVSTSDGAGKSHSYDRIRRVRRCDTCAARIGTAAMEASPPHPRGRRVALLNFETARASRRARRHGRSQPRKPAAGDPERIGRSAASQSHRG